MKISDTIDEFREILDEIMIKALHRRVILYGYESYTGRFLKWYAEYYHDIRIDYLVSTDMSRGRAYDQEIFRPSLLEFEYRDVKDAYVWLAEPLTNDTEKYLEKYGYIKNDTYFDFYTAIYGNDIIAKDDGKDIFHRKKVGRRDIQFLEWLEWKYDCNFVTRIKKDEIAIAGEHNEGYGVTTQKEIFEILSRCHCIPHNKDAIFDYGCGKGGAVVSFLDYGFEMVGGVEYEPHIYEVLMDNMKKLNVDEESIELICNDAVNLNAELDKYNWFYFFLPFDIHIFKQCIVNICKSYKRKQRKIKIISILPYSHNVIEETGVFRLIMELTIDMRQRVVHIYETR